MKKTENVYAKKNADEVFELFVNKLEFGLSVSVVEEGQTQFMLGVVLFVAKSKFSSVTFFFINDTNAKVFSTDSSYGNTKQAPSSPPIDCTNKRKEKKTNTNIVF